MFERFTDRAREVMALANESAERFGHDRIGTEHIFLALMKVGQGRGAEILRELGVDTEKMLAEISQLAPRLAGEGCGGRREQTPGAIEVIQHAVEQARLLKADHIGTEHILLGLLAEGQGIAAVVLGNLGVTLEAARGKLSEGQEGA